MQSISRKNSVKTFTHLSSALTLGVLLAGQVALAAPFSYEYNDTIHSGTTIAGLNAGEPVKIIVILDNGGATKNSQTWTSADLQKVIFNFNNGTLCTTFSSPFGGALTFSSGDFMSDAGGSLTNVMSDWGDNPVGTDYSTNGGTPSSWFLSGGNDVYGDAGGGVELTNVGNMKTAANWASSAVSACPAPPPPPVSASILDFNPSTEVFSQEISVTE